MTADQLPSKLRTKTRSCTASEDGPINGKESCLNEQKDGGWGWFIALGSFVSSVIAGGLERSGGIFYLKFLDRYGGSAVETAWVTALFSSFRPLFAPLASAMVNRFSGRTVVFAGALLAVAGVLVSGFSVNLISIYFSYGVFTGIGVSFIYTPGIILTGQYFNKRRGTVVGLASVGAALGAFIFPPFIQLLFETHTFKGTYLLLSGIVAHSLVVGALYRSPKLHQRLTQASLRRKEIDADSAAAAILLMPHGRSSTTNVNKELECINTPGLQTVEPQSIENSCGSIHHFNHESQSEESKTPRVLDWSHLKNSVFICLCLQSFLYYISFNIIITFVPALVNDRGLTSFQGSTLMSIMGIADAVSRIIASIVLDLKWLKPYRLYVFNSVILITMIVSALFPSMSKFWHFVVLCAINGSLIGTYISQWSVVIIDVVGVEHVSSGIGIVLGVNGFSALVAPTFGGFLKDSFGTYTPAFYFGSAGLFLSASAMALCNFGFQRREKKQPT